jgi:hypothetical protein
MLENLKKIKYRNFKIWFSDQIQRKVWFRNFFITRNAWGAFSLNSHINQHTGQPKVMYNTKETAKKCAEKMSEKRGAHFSYYKCLFCDGYHIGKNRDNKIPGYDK